MKHKTMRVVEDGFVVYHYEGPIGAGSIKSVRTIDEINEEISKLNDIILRVRPVNNLGNSNVEIIKSEIYFLETGDVKAKRVSLDWLCSSQNVRDFLTDRDECPMSELWEMSACN